MVPMADDAFQLTLHEMPGYLHARATGSHTQENAARFLREAYLACVERGYDALLLEMALTGSSLGSGPIYSVVASASTDGTKLRRIAYVDGAPRPPEAMKFAENVAVNRGVNVRLFSEIGDAREWLSAKK
jgi:hypothetical protein